MNDDQRPTKARLGRPRSNPRETDLEPREEILRVSARLFTTRGYTTASTREIADEAGLRQGSLFHYFDRKQDILAELLDRTLDFPFALHAQLSERGLPPAEHLFLLAYADVRNLTAGHDNLGALELLPEVRADDFASFWERRALLRTTYRTLVERGCESAVFKVSWVEVATDLIFGLVESTILWFDRASGGEDAEATAQALASGALRMVLADSNELEAIRRQAMTHFAGLELPVPSSLQQAGDPLAGRLLPLSWP